MRNNWQTVKLKDISTEISYGYTASATEEDTGVKFLRITDIVNTPFTWASVPFCEISSKDAKKYKLQPGDIVIARTGATTGTTYTLKENVDAVFASYLIRYKINDQIANPIFVGYNLKSENWTGYVENIIGGSAQPGANAQQFADYEFMLPPLKDQNLIAETLSSLDDKIDLLHRNNKTLEQLAETIFRQWFVEEAEEDWEEKSIDSVARLNPDSLTSQYEQTEIEYLDTSSITSGSISAFQSFRIEQAPSRAKRLVKDYDIIYSLVRPDQKHFGILQGVKNNTVVSTGFCVIRATSVSPYFIYMLLTDEEMVDYLHSIAEGSTTTYPSLVPSDLGKLRFKLPPTEKLEQFHRVAEGFWTKINNNHRQINALTRLRDSLLPKLLDGSVHAAA